MAAPEEQFQNSSTLSSDTAQVAYADANKTCGASRREAKAGVFSALTEWGQKTPPPNSAERRQTHAEWTAARLLEFLVEKTGPRHFQGLRKPAVPSSATSPALRRFATERFHRVPDIAARALVAWGDGHPVELWLTVPNASDVLRLQARGQRCVSVLDPTTERDRLGFLLHDLCHLGKFVCSEHFVEQVGFFDGLERVLAAAEWTALEADLDDEFRRDRDHVASDMNGSSVFLFAAFKMKLKMAARRLAARRAGQSAPMSGALTAEELAAFDALFESVLDVFGFEGRLRDAAVGTSTRRDSPELASLLVEHFRGEGARVLSAEAHSTEFEKKDAGRVDPEPARLT